MKSLIINCPKCKEVSELFLASRPYLIILSCPHCKQTLLYNEGRTYEISKTKILEMKKNQLTSFVQGLKKRQSSSQSQSSITSEAEIRKAPIKASGARHRAGEDTLSHPISHDDVLNIKIALESSTDVLDFIQHM